MKLHKRPLRRMTMKCVALYRLFTQYRKRVRMVQLELGNAIEAC